MEIFKIAMVGIIATIIIVLIKDIKGELAIGVGVAGSVIILIMTVNMLTDVVVTFNNIIAKTGISSALFVAVLKIIGIGYVTEFASNICEDAQNKSIATKIQFAGKVIIMVLALPIVEQLVEIISTMF